MTQGDVGFTDLASEGRCLGEPLPTAAIRKGQGGAIKSDKQSQNDPLDLTLF